MDSNTILRRDGSESSMPQPPGSSTKSILIANGSPKEGALIRNSLEACGYDVSCWTDVADARDRLKVKNFDIVTFSTNVGSKSMDALLEDLRSRKLPPKVILIADEDEGDAAARCFLRTVVVVNRPFKVGEVADIVEHLIGAP
jgi:DNA-binding response OmpR family regulator